MDDSKQALFLTKMGKTVFWHTVFVAIIVNHASSPSLAELPASVDESNGDFFFFNVEKKDRVLIVALLFCITYIHFPPSCLFYIARIGLG